jgi:2-keto-4-pentenoate hydratase
VRRDRITAEAIAEAAGILWSNWSAATRIDALPELCRPATRADGYAIQASVARAAGQPTIGWKIAATSIAGQKHIGVDGPLAGRLLGARVFFDDRPIPFVNNIMRVAEAEFCFRMARDLPPRNAPYTVAEVVAAVASAHPSIEVPDSRYQDFATVGAPHLIADMACACWLAIGAPFPDVWRRIDLSEHPVDVSVNAHHAASGSGKAVLGDPRIALAWLANDVCAHAGGLKAGDYVTTGTCVVPVMIGPGDRIAADYGALGRHAVAIG